MVAGRLLLGWGAAWSGSGTEVPRSLKAALPRADEDCLAVVGLRFGVFVGSGFGAWLEADAY